MAKKYKYKAMKFNGRIHKDCMRADNVLELEQRISRMEMDLISFKEVKDGIFNIASARVSRKELINFVFQMEQLIKSGVPILEGLSDLKDTLAEGRMSNIMASLINEIESGKRFSEALATFPDVFDTVFVALIRVGEESGRMPEVLKDLAETLKWHDELIEHTKKIMIYPSIVSLVVIAVVSFIMLYVVPKLIPFIQDVGGAIPLHTKILIFVSSFLADYWFLLFGLPVVFYLIVKVMAGKNQEVRLKVDYLKLKVWLFGPLIMKTNLSRLANYLAMMYRSGLTVIDSLKLSETLVNNAVLSRAVTDARMLIEEGEVISKSFKSVSIYPPLVIRMIKVGENTGALDEALLNISYFYNREVRESVAKLETAITPVLTIILGLIMGWIMMSVMGPVYDSLTRIVGN